MEITIKIDTGEEEEVCKKCGKFPCECNKLKIKKRKLKNGVENILEMPNQTEIEGTPGNNQILNMMGM